MYRLIATDIDDTLLAPDGSLPEANRKALERLHARGVAVVLSSGRATASIVKVAEGILPPADDEYLISFNGARVTTLLTGTVLHERKLTPEAIRTVMRYVREQNLLVLGYRDDSFVTERDDPRCHVYARNTRMNHRIVDDLEAALPEGSPKLLIMDDSSAIAGHQRNLREAALRAGVTDFTTVSSKPQYLEVVHPGVSKGDALLRLAEHLGIPVQETIAVGDSMNDREMLEAAGMGIAVANAREELKAVADFITECTAEEGALEEVERRFWGT